MGTAKHDVKSTGVAIHAALLWIGVAMALYVMAPSYLAECMWDDQKLAARTALNIGFICGGFFFLGTETVRRWVISRRRKNES